MQSHLSKWLFALVLFITSIHADARNVLDILHEQDIIRHKMELGEGPQQEAIYREQAKAAQAIWQALIQARIEQEIEKANKQQSDRKSEPTPPRRGFACALPLIVGLIAIAAAGISILRRRRRATASRCPFP